MKKNKALEKIPICLLTALFALLLFAFTVEGAELKKLPPFVVGATGCPMAHCDAQMTDNNRQVVPAEAALISHSNAQSGSAWGLGCVSNGKRAACSFSRYQDALEVYDYDGTRLWGSGRALNIRAWAVAPIIDQSGHVIAADNRHIIRFDEAGRQIWVADMPGNFVPISLVINSRGTILLATRDGLIATYQPDGPEEPTDGIWASYDTAGRIAFQDKKPTGLNYYTTLNTPAFNRAGDRAYVLMAKHTDARAGALIAMDVQEDGRLSLAWSHPFQGPSGASPLVIENVGKNCKTATSACKTVLYFDGCYDLPRSRKMIGNAQILAVEDRGDSAELLWDHRVAPSKYKDPRKTIQSSFAADSRGCMWYYTSAMDRYLNSISEVDDPELVCLAYEDGHPMMTVNPGCLLGRCDSAFPSSVVTMAQDEAGTPVLLFNLTSVVTGEERPIWVAAIRPEIGGAHTLLWSFELDSVGPHGIFQFNGSQGQFPILADPSGTDGTRMIFTTDANGLYIVGDLE